MRPQADLCQGNRMSHPSVCRTTGRHNGGGPPRSTILPLVSRRWPRHEGRHPSAGTAPGAPIARDEPAAAEQTTGASVSVDGGWTAQ